MRNANRSFYYGGGASIGESPVRYSYQTRGGQSSDILLETVGLTGLQGELAAGWEHTPINELRFFAEASLTLPINRIYVVYPATSDRSGDERFWAPTAAITAGLGF